MRCITPRLREDEGRARARRRLAYMSLVVFLKSMPCSSAAQALQTWGKSGVQKVDLLKKLR